MCIRDREREDEVERPAGDQKAQGSAQERQEAGLGEQLPDQPPPTRSDREPDGHFRRAAGGARQQQVGDVRARDSSTKPVTLISSTSGVRASLCTRLWPRGSTTAVSRRARNCFIVWSLMPF